MNINSELVPYLVWILGGFFFLAIDVNYWIKNPESEHVKPIRDRVGVEKKKIEHIKFWVYFSLLFIAMHMILWPLIAAFYVFDLVRKLKRNDEDE